MIPMSREGGGDEAAGLTALQAAVEEFGDLDEGHKAPHPEERFIAAQKHTAKAGVAKVDDAEKAKALSNSKQRDQKIYLTQEVS